MSVESVLSEILGVPCGNVKFTREADSGEPLGYDYYIHGMIRHYIEFTTKKPLEDFRVGSVIVITMNNYICKYQAVLVKGEETLRIVRAIADELV